MKGFLFCSLTATAVAQGFLQLDVSRKPVVAGVTRRLPRRQNSIKPFEIPIAQNSNMLEYIVNVTVGEQSLGVTLDTGSSDLWVPTPQMCRRVQCDLGSFDPTASSTYKTLLEGQFNITYAGPGDSDAGDWGSDNVAIGDGTAIQQQVIGVALDGFDSHGVLGIGYDTNEAQPNPARSGVYKNVIDNLASQGIIARKAYSIYLNSLNESTGSIIFGGIDSTKFTGPLVALPLQQGPSGGEISEFYVTLTSVVFNDATGASSTLTPDGYAQSVLLDTGTSSTLLDANTFQRLALGMGAVDTGDSNYVVPCQFAKSNATVSYTFGGPGGVTVTIPLSELISGQYLNQCSFQVGPPIGGVAIMGDTFLRSAYIVFDMDNNMAAVAQAAGNRESTSSVDAIPTGTTIPRATITASAIGTQLAGLAASATGSVPKVTSHRSTFSIGSPTFKLGAAATSGVHNFGPKATEVPRAMLVGAGLLAAGIVI